MWLFDMFSTKMKYVAKKTFTYHSPRYNEDVTIEKGYKSDGATYAPDLSWTAFFVHDILCDRGTWDSGKEVTRWEASNVYADILKDKGKWQSTHRKWLTYWFGGKKLQKK